MYFGGNRYTRASCHGTKEQTSNNTNFVSPQHPIRRADGGGVRKKWLVITLGSSISQNFTLGSSTQSERSRETECIL